MLSPTSTVIKASLTGGTIRITFQFNPKELAFSQSANLQRSEGAASSTGLSKISYAHPEPLSLTISEILFDGYETSTDVYVQYITPLKKCLDFISGTGAPPVLTFQWGSTKYMTCFLKQLSYNLTMFNSQGIPVRAKVSLTLEEVADTILPGGTLPTRALGPNRPGPL